MIERVLSGYCKANNCVLRVMCEYDEVKFGLSLNSVDCGHNKCPHANSCDLMKMAIAVEDE